MNNMKNSIKREQSQACLNFAERKNFGLQAKHKILSLLALLLTAATGAWAAPKFGVTEITPDMVPASWANDNSGFTRNFLPGLLDNLTVNDVKPWSGMPSGDVFLIYKYTQSTGRYGYTKFNNGSETGGGVMGTKRELYLYVNNYKVYYATAYVEPDPNIIPVTPVAGQENQWEFDMPGSDVVLTPIYSVATVLGDDDTERSFASLKEAFAAVQNGDVIKLDWDVTLTENLETSTIDGGAKFTLDLNGYTISGGTYAISLMNIGDELTFTDSSADQMGGYAGSFNIANGKKVIFDAGRYKINDSDAAEFNELCTTGIFALTPGKEFVDLEGGANANDGFTMRVAYKNFELTIGSGKFATFYMDQNITLADGTPADVKLYTISNVDDERSTATVTELTGIIAKETPMLVYNGTDDEQTVIIKVTPDDANASNAEPVEAFQGTAVDLEFTAADMADADYFVLTGGQAFAKVRGAGTISANKCWLQFDKQQTPGARQLTIVFDNGETTAIDNGQLTIDNEAGAVYDLQGRRVAKPAKGVFIQNGKKVVK